MIWQTHAVTGANTAWIAYLAGAPAELTILLAVLGGFAALIPDIDGDHAKIHNVGVAGITPFAVFRGGFKHRGFFHSAIAVLVCFILLILFVPVHTLLIAIVLSMAYASHLILDALTKSGIRFLFPKKKKYRLLGRKFAFRTGRSTDFLLMLIGAIGLVGLLMLLLPELQASLDFEKLLTL